MQRIFLLSHMRANTSLIGHILGSHPQINGYYEMHQSYQAVQDLILQKERYSKTDTLKSDARYLFDKILHNKYALQLECLGQTEIKLLLSLRNPQDTIKSIVNLFSQKTEQHAYAEPEQATQYYIERLKFLENFIQNNHSDNAPVKYFYFDAELLRTQPELLLPALQNYLQLETPLSDHYQIFNNTGKARAGDSSSNMHSGRIIKSRNNYDDIIIPEDLQEKAEQQYQRSKSILSTLTDKKQLI